MSTSQTPGHSWTRARAASLAAGVALLALLAASTSTAGAITTVQPAALAAVAPASPAFTVPADLKPEYQGQALCAPTPKPGTKALATLLTTTYPGTTVGMERACDVGGVSEHKDGRAIDWMVSVRVTDQAAAATAFLDWLLAPDASGAPAMARRLGIMYIGWNNQIWRGYGTTGWSELYDCKSNPDKAATTYDTYCHRNHIHLSLSWDGAAAATSFYDGTPILAPTCLAPTTTPTAPAAAALQLVAVPATRVLDTAASIGVSTRCRASGPGWTGARRAIAIKVTGKGGVPSTGVAAVLLRIYPIGTNTTTNLRVWTTGDSAPTTMPASSAYVGRGVSSTVLLPVASDGTVRVSTTYGATDVAADVLAWAPTSTALATTTTAGGNVHVQSPQTAATVTIAAGATVTVALGGKGGVPSSGLTGLQLRVSGAGTTTDTHGALYVGTVTSTGTAMPAHATGLVSGLGVRSTSATVASTDGRIVVRSSANAPVTVTFDVLGWYGAATSATGERFVPRAPLGIVNTSTGLGTGAVGTIAADTDVPITLTSTKVPAGTRGLVLEVLTYGAGTGSLQVRAAADTATGRSTDVAKGIWTTDLVMVPLGADLTVVLRAAGASTHVRAYVVGYLR